MKEAAFDNLKVYGADTIIPPEYPVVQTPGFAGQKIDYKGQIDNKQQDFAVWGLSAPVTLLPGANVITFNLYETNEPLTYDVLQAIMVAGNYLIGFTAAHDVSAAIMKFNFGGIKTTTPIGGDGATGTGFAKINTDVRTTLTITITNNDAVNHTLASSSVIWALKMG